MTCLVEMELNLYCSMMWKIYFSENWSTKLDLKKKSSEKNYGFQVKCSQIAPFTAYFLQFGGGEYPNRATWQVLCAGVIGLLVSLGD